MTYRDTLTTLAGSTEDKVSRVYELYEAGQISAEEAQAVIATIITKSNVRAASLAALSLAATLSIKTSVAVPVTAAPALPSTKPQKIRSLNQAVATIFQTPEREADAVMRIKRLARVEPLETGAKAYAEEIAHSGRVTGWVRQMDSNPCQLCRWWHRDGQVWPKNHRMPTHKGCSCFPQPVIKEGVTNVND